MHDLPIIKDIVIILLVSIPIIFLFKKFNIPSIVGYLAAGILIGPYGFKLISETGNIEVMAEIGVILLLFGIGLEVSVKQLIAMKKLLIAAGGSQVVLTLSISAFIFYLFGIPIRQAIFFGILVSLSSTAVVLKLLSDKNELETPYGKISLSILIFQDLAIVPIFLLLPALGAESNLTLIDILFQLVYAFGALAIIILLARFLMPKILFQLAKLRLREAFTVGIILLLLGTAYITYNIGLSFALGAFIAGLILSESEFNHQVVADIIPIKDAFNSIFFVSIGLLLNLSFVISNPLLLLIFCSALLIVKSGIILIIVRFIKYPIRVGLTAGLGLAQIGEFSFITAQAGFSYNLIDNEFYNVLIASSIFTMILTPFLLKIGNIISYNSLITNEFNLSSTEKSIDKLKDHVIIAGFGLNGRNLAKVLSETGIGYLVIELNPETVRNEKLKGENIIYGDIAREEILKNTHIENAGVIVFAISDPNSIKIGLRHAKKLNPHIYTIVRTRYTSGINEFKNLGADFVIPEEFETSLQIFKNVLKQYHVPLNVIQQQVNLFRNESYKLLLGESEESHQLINIDEILAAGLTETYFVDEKNKNINKMLEEINLRAKTSATIIAIIRNNVPITNPGPKEKILHKDTLVITGNHKSVDNAIELLNS